MNNIDEIMEMLDWNAPEEAQKNGIALAKQVKCLSAFFQPDGKNLWDNCAKVIYDRSDDELCPYLPRMFEWIQDMNWPGAQIIKERLQSYRRDEIFSIVLDEMKCFAQAIEDFSWLETLNEITQV